MMDRRFSVGGKDVFGDGAISERMIAAERIAKECRLPRMTVDAKRAASLGLDVKGGYEGVVGVKDMIGNIGSPADDPSSSVLP